MTTALHAVMIKRSLEAVDGSTLQLAWYTNVGTLFIMIPIVIVAGEVPAIMNLIFNITPSTSEGVSPLATFIWGSAITVDLPFSSPRGLAYSTRVREPLDS